MSSLNDRFDRSWFKRTGSKTLQLNFFSAWALPGLALHSGRTVRCISNDCPGVLDVGARGHERRWCTSVDEPHFHGSGLLLHGETREMKPATARHRGRPTRPALPAV